MTTPQKDLIFLESFTDRDGKIYYVDTKVLFEFERNHPDITYSGGALVKIQPLSAKASEG